MKSSADLNPTTLTYESVVLLDGSKHDGPWRLESSWTGFNASVPVLARRNDDDTIDIIPLTAVAFATTAGGPIA